MTDGLILVVEDNETNLKLVRDVLQFEGYDVLEARTGEDGVTLATERVPDLVLMDVQLPGMDGVEALHRLRSGAETASIPVVAVTALAMKDDRTRLLDAGFDGYLEKPISARELGDHVRGYLDGTEAVSER
ncbi:MAG TPA: response regulator [Acidimicrobiales bacterium]|nr:response regulator [Acidimicrobiales bacterium]